MFNTFLKTFSVVAVIAVAGFFTSCQQEDTNITDVENFVLQSTIGVEDQCGAGRLGCYELVFPVTIQFADSTTATVGSYEEMKQAIRDWFQANGGRPHRFNKPTLVLPIQVINEAGEIITVETVEQLKELRALCNPRGGGMDTTGNGGPGGGHGGGHGGPGGHGNHGGAPCFTLNFPLSVMFPDSSVVLVNSKEELKAATQAWHQNNPGQPARPEFVFPITVTLEDGTIVTVNSRDELRALKEVCRG